MCAGWRQERLHATELREVELERVSVPPRFQNTGAVSALTRVTRLRNKEAFTQKRGGFIPKSLKDGEKRWVTAGWQWTAPSRRGWSLHRGLSGIMLSGPGGGNIFSQLGSITHLLAAEVQ